MLCKIFILKSLEKLYKTINESISLNGLQTFFTQRALKGKLDIKENSQSTLNSLEGHLKDTWALRHLRHLGTRALEELEHSKDTWVLEHSRHLGTQAPRHSGHRTLGQSRNWRHFNWQTQHRDMFKQSKMAWNRVILIIKP